MASPPGPRAGGAGGVPISAARSMPPMLRWGAAMLAFLMLVAALGPLCLAYDPAEQLDPPAAVYRPPGTVLAAVRLAGGEWRLADAVRRTPAGLTILRLGHREELPAAAVRNLTASGVADRRTFLLGSDGFGRDVATRIVYGARVSLGVGLLSMALALTLGVLAGSAAALGGALADTLIMRGLDALLAFPWMFLTLAAAALLRPGTLAMIGLLGATSWMYIARLARAELLSVKRREFVLAARATGQHPVAIWLRHLLPNALTPVLMQAMLLVGNLVLVESALSFLGLGIQPPTPSWGNMIAEGQEALTTAWWLTAFPGAALALTVIAINLFGDGLRDTLDPHHPGTPPPLP